MLLDFADSFKEMFKQDLNSVYILLREGNGIDILERLGEINAASKIRKYKWRNDIRDKEFLVSILHEIGVSAKPKINFNYGNDRIKYCLNKTSPLNKKGQIVIENEQPELFILNLHNCVVSSSRIIITGKSVTERIIRVDYELKWPQDYLDDYYVEYIIFHTNYKTYIYYIIIHAEGQCIYESEEIVRGKNDLGKLIRFYFKMLDSGKDININTFMQIIYWANREEYLDVILGAMYEQFIVYHGLLPEYGYSFIVNYYRKHNIRSVNRNEVINTIFLCYGEDIHAIKLFLDYCIQTNDYGSNFSKALWKYYLKQPYLDEYLCDCVNRCIHYKYHFESELLEVFTKVYEYDKKNISLLEEIVWMSMSKERHIRQSYLQTLVNHYINSLIFSERSRWILVKASRKGIRGHEKLLAETFKYEIVNIPEEVTSDLLYYYIQDSDIWKKIQLSKSKKCAIPIGYSHSLKYSTSGVSDEHSIEIDRTFVEKNEDIITNLYHYITDEEFRSFAAEVSTRNNRNGSVLKEYMLISSNRVKNLIKRIMNNPSGSLDDGTLRQIIKSLSILLSKGKVDEVVSIIKSLSESNFLLAVDIVKKLDSRNMNKKLMDLFILLMKRSAVRGELKNLTFLFKSIVRDSEVEEWKDYAVQYIREIDDFSKSVRDFIVELFMKTDDDDIRYSMGNELYIKESKPDLILLLVELCRINNRSLFRQKIALACAASPEQYTSDIVVLALEEIKSNAGRLRDLTSRCRKDGFTIPVIYKLAEIYSGQDVMLARDLLNSIQNHSNKAKAALDKMRDCAKTIGRYYIVREIERDTFGAFYEAQDIFTGENIDSVKLDEEISPCFDYYIETKKPEGIIRLEEYYFFKPGKLLKDVRGDISMRQRLEYAHNLIELERILVEKGFLLLELSMENIIVYGDVPFPTKPYNLREFKEHIIIYEDICFPIRKQIRKKEQGNNFMDFYEEDLAEMMLLFLEKLVGYNIDDAERGICNQITKLLKGVNISRLAEISFLLGNIADRLDNVDSDSFDIKKGLNDFEILDETKQVYVVNYIVEEEISLRQYYNIVLQNQSLIRDIAKKLRYLLKYLPAEFGSGNEFVNALMISKLLSNNIEKLNTMDTELKNLVLDFLKNCLRHNVLKAEDVSSLIQEHSVFEEKDKEYMNFFISFVSPN